MGFLSPPPGNAPVVVVKDVGGDVHEYAAAARIYIAQGREVRLHECRSACTLALSVPNVCVYPNSVLRFHKAYNPITKAVNDGVSDAMMEAYPPAVRQRLGFLTREYKSLTGAELIRLGVRNCNGGPKIMVARANVGSPSSNPFSDAFGAMFAGVAIGEIPKYSGNNPTVRVEKVRVQVAENAQQDAERRERERQESAREESARRDAMRQDFARQEAAEQEMARQQDARQEALRQQVARQKFEPDEDAATPNLPVPPRPVPATPPTSPGFRAASHVPPQPVAAPYRPTPPAPPLPPTPRSAGETPSAAAPAVAPVAPPPPPAPNWRTAEAMRAAAPDSRASHRTPSPAALAPGQTDQSFRNQRMAEAPQAAPPSDRPGYRVPSPSALAPGQADQTLRDQKIAEAPQAAMPTDRLSHRVPSPAALTPPAPAPAPAPRAVAPPPRPPERLAELPPAAPEPVGALESAAPLVRATMAGAGIGRMAPRGRAKISPPTALWGAPIPGAAPTLDAEGFMPFVYRFTLKS